MKKHYFKTFLTQTLSVDILSLEQQLVIFVAFVFLCAETLNGCNKPQLSKGDMLFRRDFAVT